MFCKIFSLVVSVAAVLITLKLLLCIAKKDQEVTGYSLNMTSRLWLLSMISGELVFWCGSGYLDFSNSYHQKTFWKWELLVYIVLGILAGCLLMACLTDCQNCMVYQYVWWLGGVAGAILIVSACRNFCCFQGFCGFPSALLENLLSFLLPKLASVVIFGILQEKLFCRMYGKADCHAFVVCAMAECAIGLGMKGYLIHMLIAIILLAVMQGIKRNVGRNGNLKKGVPFLPYITISFWIVLLIGC